MSAGVIVNPLSGQGNRKGLKLAAMLHQGAPAARVVVLEHFDDLGPALAELAETGIEALFISGGDGTIQAVLTDLALNWRGPFPALGLLPHGSTNMVAGDIGFRNKRLAAQRDYIARAGWRAPDARREERPVLQLHDSAQGRRYGFFCGAGGVADATFYTIRAFNRKGIIGHLGPLATLAVTLGKTLFGPPATMADDDRFDKPYPMRIMADDELIAEGPQAAFLVTTLRRVVLGARPFWGGCAGPLRLSVFGWPPPNLLRWMPVAMYGGEDRRLPEGSLSLCPQRVEVTAPQPLVLDGEEVWLKDGQESVIVTEGPRFTFLRG